MRLVLFRRIQAARIFRRVQIFVAMQYTHRDLAFNEPINLLAYIAKSSILQCNILDDDAEARMTGKRSHRGSSQTAVAVRIVAFVVGVFGILAIPTSLVAAGLGKASAPAALICLAVAAALIASATLAARSVDPLRS